RPIQTPFAVALGRFPSPSSVACSLSSIGLQLDEDEVKGGEEWCSHDGEEKEQRRRRTLFNTHHFSDSSLYSSSELLTICLILHSSSSLLFSALEIATV